MPANAINLERRLSLVAWVAHQLGYDDNAGMLADLKECSEEWSGQQSHFMKHRILGRARRPEIKEGKLIQFDANIWSYLQAMNERRRSDERIVLKYFQYLAALAMEIVLWRRAASREELLDDLRRFVEEYNAKHPRFQLAKFQQSDMNKIAFWMATGSGKTLLMHINYRQFLHWRPFAPSNIVLVTPNEELSRQHLEEMRLSSIPCARHGESDSLFDESKRAVRIIEITKLKTEKEKKGKGVSIPVESFAGKNLIFVDEGHKGAGGEKYFKMRDALVNDGGFAVEYSATFGQALRAADRDARSEEYARAILFDYSYRYFHSDGYGKDFRVLNLSGEIPDDKMDWMMLGNLLSFCQQKIAYQSNREAFSGYNIEPPLMLMLGATVEGKKQEDADVVEFIGFLSRVASDRNAQGRPWLREAIKRILDEKSGINYEENDIFANRFSLLHSEFKNNAEDICCALLKRIFHVDGGCHGVLRLSQIKRASGEIAVYVGENDSPFALINVGAAAKVCEVIKNDDDKKIELRPDVILPSLFERINDGDSPVNILIGAKKFMEGWSSWRVSGMGLLNVGRSEGSQIIQLFGRGVRLKGKDMSLKRSSALRRISHPEYLEYVETLNIFAIRAEFMARFRDYLGKEGIAEQPICLPIRKQDAFFKKGLMVPEFPGREGFNKPLRLAAENGINVSQDMTASLQSVEAAEVSGNFAMEAGNSGQDYKFGETELMLLDMDALRLRLLNHKRKKGYDNLWIEENESLRIILRDSCSIRAPQNFLSIDDCLASHSPFLVLGKINIIAGDLLCKYADSLFGRHLRKWETEKAKYAVLEESHSNFQNYRIRLNKEDDKLMRHIEAIINDESRLQTDDVNGGFPRIYFDRHLYWPLLLAKKEISVIPPGLNEGEMDFVNKLRKYAERHPQPQDLKDCEIFLLRNLSRGKGIGFYETQGFYPDFILWIKRGDAQQIIFVEPHGMFMENEYAANEKARLHEKMDEITRNLGWKNIRLDSFIISVTSFEELRDKWGRDSWTREKFDNHHILFSDDDDYVSAIFRRR